MFAKGEMGVLKQMDSLLELFVVHEGEDIHYISTLFTFLVSGRVTATLL